MKIKSYLIMVSLGLCLFATSFLFALSVEQQAEDFNFISKTQSNIGMYFTGTSNDGQFEWNGVGNRFRFLNNVEVTGHTSGTSISGDRYLLSEGTNAKMGTFTLGLTDTGVGSGSVTTTAVGANSRIFLTNQTLGGTAGALYIVAKDAGSGFHVSSTAADTSTIAWVIIDAL